MTRILICGLMSALTLHFQPQAETTCQYTQGSATAGATSTGGNGPDQAVIDVFLGTSQAPLYNLHEYEVTISLAQALAPGATVDVDFGAGWVQGSNSNGYASLNSTRDQVTVHYTMPSCVGQDGYGLVAELLVNNKGTALETTDLVTDSGVELIILIDEE